MLAIVAISFREILVYSLPGILSVERIRAHIASAMPLLRVYAMKQWIVKGSLPVFQGLLIVYYYRRAGVTLLAGDILFAAHAPGSQL